MELVGVIFRVYIFLGTRNMNTRFVLKPEVELMVFLRMRSKKYHEKRRKCHKMEHVGVIYRVYIFLGTRNMNTRYILKPEVGLVVFVRMRN